MIHIKMQLGCLIVLLYIAVVYCFEYKTKHRKIQNSLFIKMLFVAITAVIFDGITAYTVNNFEEVNTIVNHILHACFFISLDTVIFLLFIYMLRITGSYPIQKSTKIAIYCPYIANIIIVILCISSTEYVTGTISNYSTGISAYTCFIMAFVYIALSCTIFFKKWNYIAQRKKIGIATYIFVLITVTVLQSIFPEILITCIGVTVFIVALYMNLEDPAFEELKNYHKEVVISFSNLIENRDNSTGEHIKRTSMYVQKISEALLKANAYQHILTKDYIDNLCAAAPMHDIGKISIADAILQKPGRLTNEEFEEMKQHTIRGAKIIEETFTKLNDAQYLKVAYEVALYHHEKWNGRGYPYGLSEKEIPLCARIMAIADVFDAVSEKRCYRDALPLEDCFDIIKSGKGTDFDPVIVDAFFSIKEEITKIHNLFNQQNIEADIK